MKSTRFVMAAVVSLGLLACSGAESEAPVCSVTQVGISPSSGSLQVGQTLSLAGSVTQTNCSPVPSLTWASSNTSVASVSPQGEVTAVAAGSATISAAASGKSASAEITVINVPVAQVTLSAASTDLEMAATLTPTVQLRSAAGATLSGRAVTWTSSNPAIATVSLAGLVSGIAPGGVTITATSEGVSGTLVLSVIPTSEHKRFAYLWNNNAASPLDTGYVPTATYSHNASGGSISVKRVAVGSYQVTYGRLGKARTSFRETILVSSYGSGGEHCVNDGWGTVSADLIVYVSCYNTTGAPVNARFTALVVGSGTLTGKYGFSWNPDAALTNSGNPSYQFSTGGTLGHTLLGTGNYRIAFGLSALATSNVQMSTYSGTAQCRIAIWDEANGTSNVTCASDATPTNSHYTSLMLEAGRPGKRWGYIWANYPSAPVDSVYQPHSMYQKQSNGQAASARRVGTGYYLVSFPGLQRPAAGTETFIVTPYGGSHTCQVEGWANNSAGTAMEVAVRCRNASRALANGSFSLLMLE